jgi:hypothetical protein
MIWNEMKEMEKIIQKRAKNAKKWDFNGNYKVAYDLCRIITGFQRVFSERAIDDEVYNMCVCVFDVRSFTKTWLNICN